MRRDRFKDAPWFGKEHIGTNKVIIGGSGGIGSWLTLMLSRAGFVPIVYDFDRVEDHNLGGQLFSQKSVGKLKVEAIRGVVEDFSDGEIITYDSAYDEKSTTNRYVFSAFDNMKARKDMFESWYENYKQDKNAIFIDGRLLMEQMEIFCVTPETAEKYREEYLFEDNEVDEVACTLKQTSHSAAMIASHMVGFFTNHITRVIQSEKSGKESKARVLPFAWKYFIPLNLTETHA